MTPVRRWFAAAVMVPLLAAGCSEDPEPRFEESPSPTESTSAAAEPKAWEVKSEAGAVAFAKHWIDVFNEAAATGETEELNALTGPTCQTCKNFVDFIDDIYREGGRYESAGWSVGQATTAEGLETTQASVAMRVRQPLERIHRPGRPVEQHESATVTYSATLGWEGGRWQMNRLLFLS